MRILKLPSITFLYYEAIINHHECAKYTAYLFFWHAFQLFLPDEYKRSRVLLCWRGGQYILITPRHLDEVTGT